jgi:hypothetical protein
MRSLYRYPDQEALDIRGGQRWPEALGKPSPLAGSGRGDERPGPQVVEAPPTLERWDLVESRWGLGSGGGVAGRCRPRRARCGGSGPHRHRRHVVSARRGRGGLAPHRSAGGAGGWCGRAVAGARGGAALVGITVAMAAGVAAIEPELVADELALERWWAVALAAAGAGLAVVSMVPWPHFVERHYSRAAGTLHAAAHASTRSPGAAQPVRTPSSVGWP